MTSSTISIQVERLQDVHREILPMFNDHWEECGCAGGPEELAIDYNMYNLAERNGQHIGVAVRSDGVLIGYGSMFLMRPPHHRHDLVATGDCFFVVKEHRKGSVGLRLLKFMEAEALDRGASYMTLLSNTNTPVDGLLRRLKYTETDITYTKKLGE